MTKITITVECDNAEEARSWLAGETRTETAVVTPAPVPAPAVPNERSDVAAAPAPASPTAEAAPEVDVHGMPYDPAIHTTTRTLNADGTWKALRGKADEAKAAKQEFLARGGTAAPAEPAPAPAPGGMPGMPGTAAPAPAPAVRAVSMEELVGKTTELMNSGKLSNDALRSLYDKVLGGSSPEEFTDNADLRLSMMTELEAI